MRIVWISEGGTPSGPRLGVQGRRQKMTITELREIARVSGLSHAEFCVEQITTQIGRETAAPLWADLAALQQAAWDALIM